MIGKKKAHFVVHYRNPADGKTMTLRAGKIHDSTLGLTFISVSDFIFKTGNLVVDPDEENVKKKLENVKTLHLSIYHIISIEEVGEEHQGLAFQKDKSNILVLPGNSLPSPPPSK